MNWRDAARAEVPEWFWKAVETKVQDAEVEVDGCDVHYRVWGDPANPGLLLVHGMHAHSRWWDFIAPSFMDRHHVVALDFTGMGDSDYRHDYSLALFAEEIIAVIEAARMRDTMVAAHSFGGRVALIAATHRPDLIRGLVLLDSAVGAPVGSSSRKRPRAGGYALYPDRETALRRFRLQPPQPCANTYILEYIARHSVFRVDEGWTWKFDEDIRPCLFRSGRPQPAETALRELQCPVGLIHGHQSKYFRDAQTIEYMRSLRPEGFPVAGIRDAAHHLFLDQPQAFTAELRTMLATLSASSS